jgi:hypothetical protein
MNANQQRALDRLRIFLNWCYDEYQDASGLVDIARRDFEFFALHFTDEVVSNYLKATEEDIKTADQKLALAFSINFAECLLKKYA